MFPPLFRLVCKIWMKTINHGHRGWEHAQWLDSHAILRIKEIVKCGPVFILPVVIGWFYGHRNQLLLTTPCTCIKIKWNSESISQRDSSKSVLVSSEIFDSKKLSSLDGLDALADSEIDVKYRGLHIRIKYTTWNSYLFIPDDTLMHHSKLSIIFIDLITISFKRLLIYESSVITTASTPKNHVLWNSESEWGFVGHRGCLMIKVAWLHITSYWISFFIRGDIFYNLWFLIYE